MLKGMGGGELKGKLWEGGVGDVFKGPQKRHFSSVVMIMKDVGS